MADRHTIFVHVGADEEPALWAVLEQIAHDGRCEGWPSERAAAGKGYSYRFNTGTGHDLEERAASVLGRAAIGSPLGDLAAALEVIEIQREALRGLLALTGDESEAEQDAAWAAARALVEANRG